MMLEVLGSQKASTVQRWIILGRDLVVEVRVWIEQECPTLGQAFIVHNKYVVGKGDDARFKLTTHYIKVALKLLNERLDVKPGSVSANAFVAEFCAPFKLLETREGRGGEWREAEGR